MYRDLGLHPRLGRRSPRARRASRRRPRGAPYAYLIYPHKPIVAYLPQTRQLLNEYCVEFPDETRPVRLRAAARLRRRAGQVDGADRRRAAPDREANMHLPGRQVDPKQVRRDLWRLRSGSRRACASQRRGAGSVPAP